MGTGIFLVGRNEELIELVQTPYDSEALLQRLLERYPSVLAGDQVDPTSPRRWLLISREVAVPAEMDGSGRWSLDHLFLDQDAIPTLVEVKRSSDTRIRREVVGQMLDYAANAVAYWPVEALQAAFAVRCGLASLDVEKELSEFLGPEGRSDTFWQAVKNNLQAGRIRLVFVADDIPSELRRIVEFLNEQMDPAEVLAVEIRQYVGEGLRSLVPHVFGQTEQAKQRKAPTDKSRQWTEELFLSELASRCLPADVTFARSVLDWARRHNARLDFGQGKVDGSVFIVFDHKGIGTYPIALWTYGKVEVQFQWLRNTPSFGPIEVRREFQQRLNEITGISLGDDALERRPGIPYSTFHEAHSYNRFFETLDWVLDRIRSV